jgi:hypothetical protein
LPDLDTELHSKILEYVTEPRACFSCRMWKERLCASLHLKCRSEFKRRLAEHGKMVFYYSAVRPLAEDFEESVAYNFTFAPDGTYHMQWTRVWDAWSTQGEQQEGHWHICLDQISCETTTPNESNEWEIRYAPSGYKFDVPIESILMTNGAYYTAPLGSPAVPWEQPARTGKEMDQSVKVQGMWQAVTREEGDAFVAPPHENARFVEIDGEMHEVSADIVQNWPEQSWPHLMKCRLRFGLGR